MRIKMSNGLELSILTNEELRASNLNGFNGMVEIAIMDENDDFVVGVDELENGQITKVATVRPDQIDMVMTAIEIFGRGAWDAIDFALSSER
jgi:hypothetical protein